MGINFSRQPEAEVVCLCFSTNGIKDKECLVPFNSRSKLRQKILSYKFYEVDNFEANFTKECLWFIGIYILCTFIE